MASNLLWSENHISRLARTACKVGRKKPRAGIWDRASHTGHRQQNHWSVCFHAESQTCDLSELLHTAVLENHERETEAASSPAMRPFWPFSSSFGEGMCYSISFLFPSCFSAFCTMGFLTQFISTPGRPAGTAPVVPGPVCTPKHNHEAEECLQSCPASGNNPAHKGREPEQRDRRSFLLPLTRWCFCQQKTSQERFLGPR